MKPRTMVPYVLFMAITNFAWLTVSGAFSPATASIQEEQEEEEKAPAPKKSGPQGPEESPPSQAPLGVPEPPAEPAVTEPPSAEPAPSTPAPRPSFIEKKKVKVVQKKYFMKMGRIEATPFFSYVTNDPYIRRLIFGTSFTYHLTEVFSLEGSFAYSPDLGGADYKKLEHYLLEEQQLEADISKMETIGTFNLCLSPIYGKVSFMGRRIFYFDFFLLAGGGVVKTHDVKSAPEEYKEYVDQWHFTTDFGVGVRAALNPWAALRLDLRNYIYIEGVAPEGEINLEMKNNFVVQVGCSFFFPQSRERGR